MPSPEFDNLDAVTKNRLEALIQDWHWDKASHEFARQAGLFLFQFIAHLEQSGLVEQTLRKQISDCALIGYLTCQYGRYKQFSPAVFADGPAYVAEFRRKVSDSEYMVASYERTWRKLTRYVQSLGYGKASGLPHPGGRPGTISVDALRGIQVLFAGDVYEIAQFLLKLDMARDKPGVRARHTVYGVATAYAMTAQIDRASILEVLETYGLPLAAVVDSDADVLQ
jgi:hypothetical protein